MNKLYLLIFLSIQFEVSFSQVPEDSSSIIKTDNFSNYKNTQTYFNSTIKISKSNKGVNNKSYDELIKEADSLYSIKNYQKAVALYEIAFKENGNQGRISHRLNAARCYSILGKPDGAFTQLFRIAEKGNYSNNFVLEEEHIFDPLHEDKRWDKLIGIVIKNKKVLEKQLTQQIVIPNEN